MTSDTEQGDAMDRASLIPHLQQTPTGVPDAIERIARIKALTGWLAAMEKPLRAWLEAKGYEVEQMTGSAFRTEAADIGKAHLSNPQPKPRISDADTFADWYAAAGGTVAETVRVHIVDEQRAAEILADVLASDSAYELSAQQVAELAASIKVTTDKVLPADPLDQLVASGQAAVTPNGVVDENGEKIPGTAVTEPGPRTLTVTPDKLLKERVARELRELLGPPKLAS